jgi:hypothetical protein
MGTIMFFHDKDLVGNGAIRDGSYRLERVPAGPAAIAIMVLESTKNTIIPTAMPQHRQRMYEKAKELGYVSGGTPEKLEGKQDIPKVVRIPGKYGSPHSSGLTLSVVVGEQNYDIELQP